MKLRWDWSFAHPQIKGMALGWMYVNEHTVKTFHVELLVGALVFEWPAQTPGVPT